MVCEYGMSERLGTITYGKRDKDVFLGRDLLTEKNYSEKTAIMIDEEIKAIIDQCKKQAKDLLLENKDKLTQLATKLLEREVLDVEEVCEIVGIPSDEKSLEENDTKEEKGSEKA